MYDSLTPILWVAITFPILWLMERWIHAHLRGLSLLLAGSQQWSVLLYALVLFPGVLLHELSHWFMAKVLGIRTGKFSLIPHLQQDGSVRLGYVEYYKSNDVGPLRESLVGGAPLIFGTTAVLLIGFMVFDISGLATGTQMSNVDSLSLAVRDLFQTEDFWLWLYLLFAISNAMLPSTSDRRAWPAFLGMLAGLTVVLFLLGFRDVVWAGVAGPLAAVFNYLGIAFSMTIVVNLFFMAIIAVLELVVGRLRGKTIRYGE